MNFSTFRLTVPNGPEADTIRQASALCQRGQIYQAIGRLTAGRRHWPESAALREALGLCFGRLGHWTMALLNLRAACRNHHSTPEGDLVRAEALWRLGHPAAAIESVTKLASRDDLDDDQLAELARVAGLCRQTRLALDTCRRLVANDLDDADALYASAVYMFQLGDPPDRIERTIRRALRLRPSEPVFRLFWGVFLWRTGRLRLAGDALAGVPEQLIACPGLRRLRATLMTPGHHSNQASRDTAQ